MKVPLSQGYFAVVDDADFAEVSEHKWYAKVTKSGRVLAQRTSSMAGGQQRHTITMHRFILKAPAGVEVDHVDGDALNNRRSNLRLATSQQNKFATRRKAVNATSNYRGVSWDEPTGKWRAGIKVNKKSIHLGRFECPKAAHEAYVAAARKHFKQFSSV